MANRNFPNGKSIYIPHLKPVLLDCNFIVDSANGNGLGIRSLKGPYIQSVFMNTSAPLAGSGNPNPEAGIILVQLQDNYNRYLGGFSGSSGPLSGSNISSGLTIGNPYVITSLGSSSVAQWQAAGLSSVITPAVGASFIAAATSIAGGGLVQAPASGGSGVARIEVIGDPNQMNSNNPVAFSGMQLILACYNSSNAIAAPVSQSTIQLSFYMNDSSVLLAGE